MVRRYLSWRGELTDASLPEEYDVAYDTGAVFAEASRAQQRNKNSMFFGYSVFSKGCKHPPGGSWRSDLVFRLRGLDL